MRWASLPMFDAKVDPCILFSILVYKAVWSVWSSLFVLYPQIIGEVFPKSATLLSVYKAMWSASSSFFVLYPQIIRVSLSTILILWAWLWAITHITNRVCSDFIYLCSTEIPSACQPHTDCYLQVNLLRFHLCHRFSLSPGFSVWGQGHWSSCQRACQAVQCQSLPPHGASCGCEPHEKVG